jgi:hypothetical protein
MMPAVFSKTLVRAFHVRSFEILAGSALGWEVFEGEDDRVPNRQCYTDWHRVERAAHRFAQVVGDLQRDGWQERLTDPVGT